MNIRQAGNEDPEEMETGRERKEVNTGKREPKGKI